MWMMEGILGLTYEHVMKTGMSARMAIMQIRMGTIKHRQPMMDRRSMWRTEDIVLDNVKIGQYTSYM